MALPQPHPRALLLVLLLFAYFSLIVFPILLNYFWIISFWKIKIIIIYELLWIIIYSFLTRCSPEAAGNSWLKVLRNAFLKNICFASWVRVHFATATPGGLVQTAVFPLNVK